MGEGRDTEALPAAEVVQAVNALEAQVAGYTSAQLRAVTGELRDRLAAGADSEAVLPSAFAAVREAARRTLGQRHFDEQIAGGVALHRRSLVEMRGGDGKTLTVVLAAYLAGLNGAGVHVLAASDDLATQAFTEMAPVFDYLGLSCGLVTGKTARAERRTAYAAEVTYGAWLQFGYDYLRDNMAWNPPDRIQRGQVTAIVDDADMIMIDEARTPLLITGPSNQGSARHAELAALAARLVRGADYVVDARASSISLLGRGIGLAEQTLGVRDLPATANAALLGGLVAALRAKELLRRGRDYVVEDGQILIVDEQTGRVRPDRRLNEDTHAALAAKEGHAFVPVRILTRITERYYLGMYERLCGITSVARTDADVYRDLYGLAVTEIPARRPVRRVDRPARFYADKVAHLAAVTDTVAARHATGQPVLICTGSPAESEQISRALAERAIAHEVVGGVRNVHEADLIGRAGAVTVAAAMIARGMDVRLGGRSEAGRERVVEAGGLYVLGTALSPTRRLEEQLRGVTGRRGDPGESEFFLCLQDAPVSAALGTVVTEDLAVRIARGQALDVADATRALALARDTAATRRLEYVERALEWESVAAEQHATLLTRRRTILEGNFDASDIRRLIDEVVDAYVQHAEPGPDGIDRLWSKLGELYPVSVSSQALAEAQGCPADAIPRAVLSAQVRADARRAYDRRESEIGTEITRELERRVALSVIDRAWSEHLVALDRSYAAAGTAATQGGDPLADYRREAAELYRTMLAWIDEVSVGYLFNLEVTIEPADPEEPE